MNMAALLCRTAFLAILNTSGLWVNEVVALLFDLMTAITEMIIHLADTHVDSDDTQAYHYRHT